MTDKLNISSAYMTKTRTAVLSHEFEILMVKIFKLIKPSFFLFLKDLINMITTYLIPIQINVKQQGIL